MALLSHTSFAGTSTPSAAIDTTGATLLIASFSSGSPADVITDSQSNTWIPLTAPTSGNPGRLFYVLNPVTSIIHTFQSTGNVPSACIGAFDTVDTFDSESGLGGISTPTAQNGSLTPSANTNLMISGLGGRPSTTFLIDSGYTVTDGESIQGGVNFGSALAYLEQASATAQNPTWATTNQGDLSVCNAVFITSGPPPTNPYTSSRKVTTDFTQAGSSDSTNFKVCIRTIKPDFATVANGGLINNTDTANGQLVPADFQVYVDLVSLVKLNFEIPYYNQATGELEIWVTVPTLSHTANTEFYIAFNAPSITTYQGSASATFASPYKLVAHLPNGTTLSAIDSSAGAHNGTITGALAAVGNIDGAASFAGGTDLIDFGSSADWNFPGSFTISAWVKTLSASGSILQVLHSGGTAGFELIFLGGTLAFFVAPTSIAHDFSNPFNDGNWHLIHGKWVPGTASIYLDGLLIVSGGSGSATLTSTDPLQAGVSTTILLDEIHAIAAGLSDDWILAEYNNQKPNSTFLVLGPLVPPIPVVTDMAYTQALQLGLPTAILQNIVYALPARACFVQCTAAVEVSNIIDSGFSTLTNANTIGAETAATWIRCTTGNATITVKAL